MARYTFIGFGDTIELAEKNLEKKINATISHMDYSCEGAYVEEHQGRWPWSRNTWIIVMTAISGKE